jgi:multiple sugar transport system substrate-binding protein
VASPWRRTRRPHRLAATAAAFVTSAALLAACAVGDSTPDAEAGMVTLNGDRADFVPAYEAVSGALEDIGVDGIDARNVPSTENYQQVIRSSLQTNSTTDIVKWWSGYRLQDLARGGGLADLTEVWNDAVEKEWVNPDTVDSFSYDGTVYGLPMYKSYWVIYYNKHVFDDLGLSVPADWDEFLANNEAIRDAGVTPLFATQEAGWTSFIWFGEILSRLDPGFYVDLMNGDASYTDEPAQEALRIWADLYARDFFTAPDVAWDNEPSLFQDGTVAQVPMGTWRNGIFVQNGMTPDDYGAYLLPMIEPGTQQAVITESGVLAVAEQAPRKEAALETMSEWLNPDVQSVWVNVIKDTSANPTVVTDDNVLTTVTDSVTAASPIELERYWEASPPRLIETAVQHFATFMVDPTEDNILPTLERLQDLADTEWASWEAAG